jgi:hypothetical protein
MFHIPKIDKKETGRYSGHWEGKGIISVPHVCSSCCSTVNLQENPIMGGYSTTASGWTGSTRYSGSVSFTAYICSECRQIHAATGKYKKKNDRTLAIWGFCILALVILSVPFVLGLLGLIEPLTRGGSILLPASVSLISVALFIGIFRFSRLIRDKLAKDKASNNKEHIKLIESYGHTYQPVLIDLPGGTTNGILRIYNNEYANLFEKMNRNFVKIDS